MTIHNGITRDDCQSAEDAVSLLQKENATLRRDVNLLIEADFNRWAPLQAENEKLKEALGWIVALVRDEPGLPAAAIKCSEIARAALRETEGLGTCKHLEVREAPISSPPGMVECASCRTLVPSKPFATGLVKP